MAALFDQYRDVVRPEWIDANGHMNIGYYVVVFDFASDAWWDYAGLTREYKESRNVMTFALESHVMYLREVREGAPLRFTSRLLDFDAKRLHLFHEMYHAEEDYLAATHEILSVHVSGETRRTCPMGPEIQARLGEILKQHEGLALPPHAGRSVGLKRKPV